MTFNLVIEAAIPPQVMAVVKGLVKDNVTIVATIHSPTAYAFGLFDSMMMLIRGKMVYFGPQGRQCHRKAVSVNLAVGYIYGRHCYLFQAHELS